jgi:hypothetical protein
MSKRKRFILTSVLLSLGFIGIQLVDFKFRYPSIFALTIFTVILFSWSLKEGLGKNLTLLTLILPAMFTLSIGLFWFLLPTSIFARVPVVILYGLGLYALCLTANIYIVAAIRTIALLRAARGVGFVLTLLTSFLIFDTILSIKSNIWVNVLLTFIATLPLAFQGLWTSKIEGTLKELITPSFYYSLILGEIATLIFFWPVTLIVGSLFLTVTLYMLLGLGQAKLEGRLFPQTVREYLIVFGFVVFGMFVATRWGA